MTPTFIRRTLLVLGLVILAALVIYLISDGTKVFLLTFVGILLSVFLYSVAEAVPLPQGVAVPLTVLLIVGGLVGLGWWFGPQLSEQLRGLTQELPTSVAELEAQLSDSELGRQLLERLPVLESDEGTSADPEQGASTGEAVSRLSGVATGLAGRFASLIGTLATLLGDLFYVVLMSAFFAAGAQTYAGGVVRLFPKDRRDRAREVLYELYKTLQGWLLGQFVAMVTIGTIVGLGLWFLGVPFALGLAFIAFVFEFIPTIGPWLAGVPAVLIALSQGPTTALWVIGLFVLVELLEGNIILPLIQRRTVDLPPALTLFSIFLLGGLFGLVGVLVAAPLAAVCLVLVKMLYLRDTLGDDVELPSA